MDGRGNRGKEAKIGHGNYMLFCLRKTANVGGELLLKGGKKSLIGVG